MKRHRYGSTLPGGAAIVLLTIASAAPVLAQDTDQRWLAWLGCWEPIEQEADAGLVCFRPADGGVEMFSVVDGELETSELIRTDGEIRTVSREGCQGTERAEFSDDRRRVFHNGEFVCGSDVPRTASGVMSLTAPAQWLDVRSVEVGGEAVAWVQRYRLAAPEALQEAGVEDATAGLGMAVRTARLAAARPIDADDVVEASQKIDVKAVEAWVAERGERFNLDADELVRLADAGVPGSVTDVMIAVSYPRRFAIDPEGRAETRDLEPGRDRGAYRGYGPMYRPLFWDPFYYGYSGLYSPYGYGGYGGYGGFYGYGYRPTTVIVDRQNTPRGRMVNGQGYTRGTAGSSGGGGGYRGGGSPPSRGSSGGRTAKPRGGRSDFTTGSSLVIRGIGRIIGSSRGGGGRVSTPSRSATTRPAARRTAKPRASRD